MAAKPNTTGPVLKSRSSLQRTLMLTTMKPGSAATGWLHWQTQKVSDCFRQCDGNDEVRCLSNYLARKMKISWILT